MKDKPMNITKEFFKKRFDTSLIEPQISDKDLVEFIERCKRYSFYFAGIAVNLHQIPLAVSLLEDSGIDPAGAIAYPLGNLPTEIKIIQIEEAINSGAEQVDIVMRVEALREGDYDSVWHDAEAVVNYCKGKLKTISLIPNTAYLKREQLLESAKMVRDLGAIYKTNTGFGLVTTLEDIKIIKDTHKDEVDIMVSGGCRTTEQAIEFFNMGVSKIATSTPIDIFEGFETLLNIQSNK
jgi:deoxyribose-phosphate aldolase